MSVDFCFMVLAALLAYQPLKSSATDINDCVDAVDARVQSLRKGVFTAVHRQSLLRSTDHSVIQKFESHVFCAFDFDHDQFRFDRTMDTDFFRHRKFPQGIPPELKAMVKPQMTFHLIRGSESSIHSVNYGHPKLSELSIKARDAEPRLGTNPIDPRMIGLFGPYYLNLNSIEKSEWRLKNVCDYLKKGKGEDLADGVVQIRVLKPLAQSIWIDTRRDFVPIRMEEANPGPVVFDPKSPPSPNTFCTFDWVRVNNQWVPAAAKMEHVSKKKKEIAVDEYWFEWKQAGEPVADVLFTPEGLRMPEKTRIIDSRLSPTHKPFVAGQLGPSVVPPDFNVPAEAGGGKIRRWPQAVLGLVAVAVVAGSAVVWRRRSRLKSAS